jgi:NAD(P)-dependent dehydrogenase (short-subunit alcohol dehydrogenase family)
VTERSEGAIEHGTRLRHDRVALVTGAASGVGRAIAVRLARQGYRLALADIRSATGTVASIDEVGAEPYSVTCDLAVPQDVERLAAGVLDRFGHCDVLVNNAAHLVVRTLEQLDQLTWRRVQAVNVDAAYQLTAAFAPGMTEREFGRIINVVSNTVWEPPGSGFLAYVTSKAAMVGFTRALAVELGEYGVTVNAIAPGLTRTPGSTRGIGTEHFETVRQRQAIKRTIEPADLAGTVAFLASDDAALITGQAIRVDGGLVTL